MSTSNCSLGNPDQAHGERPFTGQRSYAPGQESEPLLGDDCSSPHYYDPSCVLCMQLDGYESAAVGAPADSGTDLEPPNFYHSLTEFDYILSADQISRMEIALPDKVTLVVREGNRVMTGDVIATLSLNEVWVLAPGGWWMARHDHCFVVDPTLPLWRVASECGGNILHLDIIYSSPNPYLLRGPGSLIN